MGAASCTGESGAFQFTGFQLSLSVVGCGFLVERDWRLPGARVEVEMAHGGFHLIHEVSLDGSEKVVDGICDVGVSCDVWVCRVVFLDGFGIQSLGVQHCQNREPRLFFARGHFVVHGGVVRLCKDRDTLQVEFNTVGCVVDVAVVGLVSS